ncbi:probable glucan endo-1,3-beta-glucosidase A6 isoform X2 [Ricinus communis]|uniref:probable glucan endo-1,3-beta-glucosidase A6 isoform X2 n=1 Tax=Ricinus communis TaxID=3988 RepID=UPI00201A85FA|nr:probable glucan endo-1,3-beta-glucosidase A6 isoform X2 [Ricinus communis]
MATNMGVVAVIFLFSLVASSNAETSNKIGINYGQLGDNLPSPYRSIQILQSMNTGRVKLYDANPEILRLLAGTKIQVSVMVPNNEINNIASNQTIAHNWVRENVLQYYPNTMIRFILVGNEILSYSSDQDKKIWSNLVPAMRKIKNSLRSHNIQNIKVGTPLAMDVLQTTSPPSNGTFRNLIKKMTAKPPIGTPARPGVVIPTFIFSLYNENRKTGPGTERHWGLLNANGTAIYEIDLSGKQADSEYRALPQPNNNKPYKGKLWCIAAQGADLTELGTAVTFACSQGNGTCDALAPGKACYEPVSITSHASYAFSSYWAKFRRQGGGCYFNGLAKQTTTNPSYGSCEFPSVTL